eukprot:CAMPEP_0119090476 /NCGR_PEP_ID=MMETSP1178-20130426/152819_1 /TAXON_ID=33656 /ORGANISM="unid sp, Strain CCMP2000" /LENGTH=41 /DNA_ID= /DNA_START= /DNA_END= /DNA_ORIENTATION=
MARADHLGEQLRGRSVARVRRPEHAAAQVGQPAIVVEQAPA